MAPAGVDAMRYLSRCSENSIFIYDVDVGILEAKATAGDKEYGGEDFDNRIVGFCLETSTTSTRARRCSPRPRSSSRKRHKEREKRAP
mmetsp:Transcript_11219/g.8771  ORF Transcript_11219/g.8771 Transcript_11219/m.8771 type:complete len:88 (-) Transcript_11219:93-356(-)